MALLAVAILGGRGGQRRLNHWSRFPPQQRIAKRLRGYVDNPAMLVSASRVIHTAA